VRALAATGADLDAWTALHVKPVAAEKARVTMRVSINIYTYIYYIYIYIYMYIYIYIHFITNSYTHTHTHTYTLHTSQVSKDAGVLEERVFDAMPRLTVGTVAAPRRRMN
jgi:hypothetical protein